MGKGAKRDTENWYFPGGLNYLKIYRNENLFAASIFACLYFLYYLQLGIRFKKSIQRLF